MASQAQSLSFSATANLSQQQSLAQLLAKTKVFSVSDNGAVSALDAEESKTSPLSFSSSTTSGLPVVARYASGAQVSTRFSAAASPGDNFGHYRESTPPLAQQGRQYSNSTLQQLSPYKLRDLFQSQAARAMVGRKDVLKQTQSELYVPRTAKLLKAEDFQDFTAAASAYAATMANTTANARAKAAARAASLAAGTTAGAGGAGGGAAATVAAATANALANADPTKAAANAPVIPDGIDAFELSKAAATEAYLQDIWNDNRNKEAADERLKKHIKKLVAEWSSKLARFEEEVQRRQEDTYYAKFRRQDLLSKSTNNIEELKQHGEEHDHHHGGSATSRAAAMKANHRRFYEDHLLHHRHEAFTTVQTGKVEHPDPWKDGVHLPPNPKEKKESKELLKVKKQALEHRMLYGICASKLTAPPAPSALSAVLAEAAAAIAPPAELGGYVPPAQPLVQERTHLSFSSFRPATTPAERARIYAQNGGEEGLMNAQQAGGLSTAASPRPGSQGASTAANVTRLFPQLTVRPSPAPPSGLSVKQTRPSPYQFVEGMGNRIGKHANAALSSPHVFAEKNLANTAGISQPELQPVSSHVSKRLDMLDVERIKDRLAVDAIHVPRGVLERALVAPEVSFSEDQQLSQLPTPFFGLPNNPFEGGKKKGKGKKGKGSKKGKKKKT